MNGLCNRLFLVVFVRSIVAFALAASGSGCIENHSTAAPSPSVDFSQLLIDADEHSQQPTLPNDLQTPEGGAPTEITSKVEITVYGPPGCPPCKAVIEEGNKSDRFHFVKSENLTPAVQKVANDWNQGGYPVVFFKDLNGADRFVAPWRGMKDFEIRYNRTVPKKQEVALAAVVRSSPTPWNLLNDANIKSLKLECGNAAVAIGDKTLHFGPNVTAAVTRRGDVFHIDFDNPVPAVDLGFGVHVPFRLEVSKAGIDAVGSRWGITKRQRLVLQEVPE